jgi:hypothetical protein
MTGVFHGTEPGEGRERRPDRRKVEEEIAYLAKRHRVTPAIVRETMRRAGSSERGAVEREIQKGKARR